MRVLSRRSNLPKAVACGYSEGAGFVVLTEPFPLALGPSALCVRCTTPRRGVGEACRRATSPCALGCASELTLTRCPVGSPSAGGRARCDVGAAAIPRWRRRGVSVAQRPCTRLCPTLSSARSRPTPSAAEARCDGVGRRRHLSTTKTSAPPRRHGWRRSLGLVVSVTGQRQWHCCGARETTQALQHGCGDDCWRSASLAALARTIAGAALDS